MAINQTQQTGKSQQSFAGLGNLISRESRKWFHTRRWWIQALLWLFLLNGFVVFGLFVMPELVAESAAEMEQAAASGAEVMTADEFRQDVPNVLFGLATLLLPVGVIILTHSQVYGEKRSGVAAWVLSKPVSRSTYLMAKIIVDAIGIILLMVIVQMIPAYLLLSSVLEVNLSDYVQATGLLILLLLFYQAFTMMMSVLGNSTEIVLGVSFGVLLGGLVLRNVLSSIAGDIVLLTPWVLPDGITVVISGQPLPPQLQTNIIAVFALTFLCLGVMFWQFQKQEL